LKPISIFDITIHPYTVAQLNQQVTALIAQRAKALVLNVNVHCMNLAYENRWLKDFLNQAEINFCDGAGVKLGAKLLGYHIPERITYADWMWQLAPVVEREGFTMYFIGAKPGIAEKAAIKLKERYPNLQIVGTQHGYFDKTPGSAENEAVLADINALKPNILILGFGMPLQEKWLSENWGRIEANIALTGGAVFDYLSGELQRGPKWMTDNGFEWLARLLIEPKRLWQRYLVGNPKFIYRVLKERFRL
jgi:N-acetylglucosaminyldiphosphoundecaprenol N-acetyl-beta-D-mannosaminyltransferase